MSLEELSLGVSTLLETILLISCACHINLSLKWMVIITTTHNSRKKTNGEQNTYSQKVIM